MSCPHQSGLRTERRVLGLRVNKRWGPARIAYHLHLNISTVHRILTRYKCPPLRFTDPATGTRIRGRADPPVRVRLARRDGPRRHREARPDPGRRRPPGSGPGARRSERPGTEPRSGPPHGPRAGQGYSFIHHAVDDHSRYVYSEILSDETQATASAFLTNAIAAFAAHGVKIQRVMADNGSCYRSRAFGNVRAGAGISHKRTRPYRPQTNGKGERFNRILPEEWAYARAYTSETERQGCCQDFIDHYNQRRPHTALKGASPSSRVTNHPG